MRPVAQARALTPIVISGVSAMLIAILFFANPYEKAIQNQLLGLTLMVFGGVPIVRWAQRPQTDVIPVLPIIGLFYAGCYGFAGLVTPHDFMNDVVVNEEQYTPALIAALISLAMIYLAFNLGRRIPWPKTPAIFRIDDRRTDELILYFALPTAVAVDQICTRLQLNAESITGPIRDYFFVWALYSTLSGRYAPMARRLTYFVATPIYLLLYLSINAGKLAGVLSFAFLIGLTYVAGRKRVPVLALFILLPLFFALQPVKGAYRQLTWGQQTELGPIEGTIAFARLAGDQYVGGNAKPLEANLNESYSRINHLHTTAAIMAATPDYVDFRRGETYIPLLTKWIPRAIWTDKPKEDLGNRWAHRYHFIGDTDFATSYNLPWLPEMYMNFGWGGVVGISALVGLLMSALWNIVARGATLPSQFAAGMMFCSVFFFPESNVSIEIGILMIMLVVLSSLSALLSMFSGRARLRAVAAA